MDRKTQLLISEIETDLNFVQHELETIAIEMGKFEGIGTDLCAKLLSETSQDYQAMLKKFREIK